MVDSPRKLPHQDKRVETGAVQFGDDWPGIFIRGDCAFGYAMYLRAVLEYVDEQHELYDVIAASSVHGLLELLESSNVNST